MALKQCKIIYNDINKPLFKYPDNTLLDTFPFELWEIVLKYYHDQLFLGYSDKEYVGFRKMVKTDITDYFKEKFINYLYHGFNVCNFDSVNHLIILIDDYYFLINECKCLLSYNHTKTWYLYFPGGIKCHEIYAMKVGTEKKQIKHDNCYATFFIPNI